MTRLQALPLLFLFACDALGNDDLSQDVGVVFNWSIETPTAGSPFGTKKCLEVGAASVEWRLESSDGVTPDVVLTFDCDVRSAAATIRAGHYSLATGRLRRGDGVVLASCTPELDEPLTIASNHVGACTFVLP